jgi:hypothetical protein
VLRTWRSTGEVIYYHDTKNTNILDRLIIETEDVFSIASKS